MARNKNYKTMFGKILAAVGAFAVVQGFLSRAAKNFMDNIVLQTGKPSLSFENASNQVLTVHLPVIITNMNPFTIDFDSIEGQAFLGERLLDAQGNVLPNGGLKLSNVFVYNRTPIQSGESAALTILFDVNISNTLQQIVTQVQAGYVPLTTNIHFYGWLNLFGTPATGGIKIPLQFPISLIPS